MSCLESEAFTQPARHLQLYRRCPIGARPHKTRNASSARTHTGVSARCFSVMFREYGVIYTPVIKQSRNQAVFVFVATWSYRFCSLDNAT